MSNALNFDTGEIKLAVNGDPDRLLIFNPDDANLRSRFYEVSADMNTKGQEMKKKGEELKDGDDETAFEYLKEMDTYFREKVDYIFGEGSAGLIFKNQNLLSIAGNGDFILANFLSAIAPHFQSATDDRVKKFTAKYEQHPAVKKPVQRRKK